MRARQRWPGSAATAQDYPAELAETGGVAAGLMNTGRLGELDDYVSALAVRHRAQGPPTLLYVALSMLGYSALLQGKPDLADRFFDEAISIDVPDRTVSVNKPIEARAAFRRGNRSAAFRILRAYVHELLETDYPDLAANAAVEFINMMAIIDRLPAAARVLDYLRAAGDFGALAARTLVADAAAQIAADADRIPTRIGHPNPGSTLGTRSGTCGTSSTRSNRLPPNDVPRAFARRGPIPSRGSNNGSRRLQRRRPGRHHPLGVPDRALATFDGLLGRRARGAPPLSGSDRARPSRIRSSPYSNSSPKS